MRDEVVSSIALNIKWIPMVLSGFFDSGDGSKLSFDLTGGKVMVETAWLPAERNWLLKSFAKQESSGVATKNRCLALGLLEIPVRPPWTFKSLLSCSHAWSAPIVTEMFPSSNSLQVSGCSVLSACISAM
jgi:hypothetical protein